MANSAFILVLSVCTVYALVAVFIILGLRRQTPPVEIDRSALPFVSILIAARNEEANLPGLFASLRNLNYPVSLFEIIFIDDDSTDRTRSLAREQLAYFENLRIISPWIKYPRLNGKANALQNAMQQARGQFVFITDADCTVPADWIRRHLGHYSADTAMVGGITVLKNTTPNKRLFYHLQSQDWLYLLCSGSAAAAWGLPFSIVGNNMSFRRQAYNLSGGFEQIGSSVVEDYALMSAFQKCGLPIKLCTDSAIVVTSSPVAGLHEFLSQRKRWAAGAKTMSLSARLLLLIGFSSKLLPAIAIATGAYFEGLFLLLFITISDSFLLFYFCSKTARPALRRHAWLYSFFALAAFLVLLPFIFFSKKVEWKGRQYPV